MSETIHVKKFAGGKETPEEMWRRLVARDCYVCPQRGALQIRTLIQLKELVDSYPEVVAQIMVKTGGTIPCFPTKYGPMVVVSDIWACPAHSADAEKAAARDVPSWAIVEINRGPGAPKAHGQVAASIN